MVGWGWVGGAGGGGPVGEPLGAARGGGVAAGWLTLALLQGLPTSGTPLLTPELPVVLDTGRPAWEADLSPQPVGSLVVESALSNGAALPLGTPAAILRLWDAAGRSVDWTLRAGEETGEVAARRPDVAREGRSVPQAWISWVAGDFFAQRYRAQWSLDRQALQAPQDHFVKLRIERAPGLPSDVEIAVYQLEVRK